MVDAYYYYVLVVVHSVQAHAAPSFKIHGYNAVARPRGRPPRLEHRERDNQSERNSRVNRTLYVCRAQVKPLYSLPSYAAPIGVAKGYQDSIEFQTPFK